MIIGYADPPYPGQSKKHYADHPDYGGEVDHEALIDSLYNDYDGFVLHTNSVSIPRIAPHIRSTTRWMAWVKPFAAFKRNVPVAYAWEPVLVEAVRKPVVSHRIKPLRDWFAESITLKRGLTGAKPAPVCKWLFECVGAQPDDAIKAIFPGSGAVTLAWREWQQQYSEQ